MPSFDYLGPENGGNQVPTRRYIRPVSGSMAIARVALDTGVWAPVDIRYALAKAGWTVMKVAAHLGVSHSAVSNAIARRNGSKKIEVFIAGVIGVERGVLFPLRKGAKA